MIIKKSRSKYLIKKIVSEKKTTTSIKVLAMCSVYVSNVWVTGRLMNGPKTLSQNDIDILQ